MTRPEPQDSQTRPGDNEIRTELERLLQSQIFEQAGRSTEFLRYVVEETLAGRADRLKGYTIAVAVFDRPADFDAQTDPLVRVEAGRLRRRLMEYYIGEGHDDPVRIELPRGGYEPRFSYPTAPRGSTHTQAEMERRLARPLVVGSAASFAALLTAALVWWALGSDRDPAAGRPSAAAGTSIDVAAGMPRMLVLPLASFEAGSELDALAAGITEEIILALVEFNIIAVASPADSRTEPTSLEAMRRDFGVGYVLAGSVRTEDDRVRVAIRLVDTDLGTQLWTTTIDEHLGHATSAARLAVAERISGRIAEYMSSPYGPVYAHEIVKTSGKPVAERSTYECILRFYEYVQSLDVAGHAESRACLERAVRSTPELAAGWSGLAVVSTHEHMYGYNPQAGQRAAIDRALEAARTSLDIDGSGRVAAIAMAGIWRASGQDELFSQAVDRALSIQPPHPAVLVQVGYWLTLSGDWQRGVPLIEQALPATTHPPGWLNAAFAFRYLLTRDYEQALVAALRVDAPEWFLTPLTVSASAALAGRDDLAQRERQRLLELKPDFASSGRELLGRWNADDALVAVLIEGLSRAGLELD